MNTYTDQQLQLALAKMSQDRIIIRYEEQLHSYMWNINNGINSLDTIKDTEWLHVCWLVEQSLDELERVILIDNLYQQSEFPKEDTSRFKHYRLWWTLCIASWQNRAIALARVKGVKIV